MDTVHFDNNGHKRNGIIFYIVNGFQMAGYFQAY